MKVIKHTNNQLNIEIRPVFSIILKIVRFNGKEVLNTKCVLRFSTTFVQIALRSYKNVVNYDRDMLRNECKVKISGSKWKTRDLTILR
jgi:hypothetical protein